MFSREKHVVISIHVLREEDDSSPDSSSHEYWYFYPRPPRGGRLNWAALCLSYNGISIHVLREEDDP